MTRGTDCGEDNEMTEERSYRMFSAGWVGKYHKILFFVLLRISLTASNRKSSKEGLTQNRRLFLSHLKVQLGYSGLVGAWGGGGSSTRSSKLQALSVIPKTGQPPSGPGWPDLGTSSKWRKGRRKEGWRADSGCEENSWVWVPRGTSAPSHQSELSKRATSRKRGNTMVVWGHISPAEKPGSLLLREILKDVGNFLAFSAMVS